MVRGFVATVFSCRRCCGVLLFSCTGTVVADFYVSRTLRVRFACVFVSHAFRIRFG